MPHGLSGSNIFISSPFLLKVEPLGASRHELWKPGFSPLTGDIEPGKSRSAAVKIRLDWQSLAKSRLQFFYKRIYIKVCLFANSPYKKKKTFKTTVSIPPMMLESAKSRVLKAPSGQSE